MFAVLKTGGKQYKVQAGDTLRIEKLAAKAGDKVQFNEVMMIGGDTPTVGAPLVADAGVQAEVIDHIKGVKTINFVKRRRKHSSKRTKGHRQQLTLVRITDILASGADKSGVMAAVGGAGYTAVFADGQNAKLKTAQAEKARKADAGEAAPAKAPKKAKAAKAEAAAGADDLKKLSGVGPALEKKLHEAGVTTFAQIAAWTEADVADIDEKLSFKGRIEREGWIEQAKDMTKG
ncbi:50S ribosomal protein L21 [Pseudosulfitobacter pseudonitzschiae]|uniref:Large ribosomal subunit protein bL21 n=1 Tax=Pseudosulfitobacter pseudonitzschiae TaxID=1402135 RepID=A0A073J4S2_9RHOB|nr:50S ribosomal protein L21 [Pseudosulfitobacter pseudonitzschiae]KEJ97598.1 50S ribosomal protein L21 [Pseudosulfitobacter pseudonitzschiae]MBM1814751.1 50S ribosomal protein L21 [Pseudosulfitobacter pseudonitzschiae]MBM1831745.1 50S ribosomal protein L21 [Pseudosulfitobacter pseudonitzschiae]MBM1836610.1 50S ribosomal protein L21 [Pseudosulfitobacter pseudonitzschiae]MBM1841457.1 50S ribosomal protein L21 [Pseudosulfitobacter pseudonitzschiae]